MKVKMGKLPMRMTIVTLCVWATVGGEDLEKYQCPPEKPFMCSNGMCVGFQEYCIGKARMVASCFQSDDEASIRKECYSGRLPTVPECRYACMNRYPDLKPFPERVSSGALGLSEDCHFRQRTGFQSFCKDRKTVSCFPNQLTSIEDQLAFCRSEEGRNLSSQPSDHPCQFACVDAFLELLENGPSTTTNKLEQGMTTIQQIISSENTEPNVDKTHVSSPSDDRGKDTMAAECTFCGKDIIIAVFATALTILIGLFIVTIYLVKKGKLSFGNGNQRKPTNNANADETDGVDNEGNDNDIRNHNQDLNLRQRGPEPQADPANPTVVEVQEPLLNGDANGEVDDPGQNRDHPPEEQKE